MSVLEWKSVNFFRLEPYFDGLRNKLSCLDADITSYCYNALYCVFCDQQGYVHVIKFNSEKVYSFRAHDRAIQKCAISKENSYLALLIQNDRSSDVHLNVYNILGIETSKIDVKKCICQASWVSQSVVCALHISLKDDVIMIAVGCEKGNLFFHRGLLREASLNFRCYSVTTRSIKGIEIHEDKSIFICTEGDIFCYKPIENLYFDKKVVLDQRYSNGCCALQTGVNDPYFLVGRTNAVYCYTTDGRASCYAIDGEKICIVWYRNYLAMLTFKDDVTPIKNLIVIDVENKLIVMQKKIPDAVGLLTNNTDLYVFTTKNEIFLLEELSLQKKIQLLLNKNIFDLVFRYINVNECGEEILAETYMKYGDYYMAKNKLTLASEYYVKTIGYIEPYHIIKKLLNLKQNNSLFQYLSALLDSGHARNRHTQLLLKCNEREDLASNVDIYLKYGISYGFPQYSLTKSGADVQPIIDFSFSSYLKIIHDDKICFKFLSTMEENKLHQFISEYSTILFTRYPQETIEVLIKLYKHLETQNKPINFTPLLLPYEALCRKFLQDLLNSTSKYKISWCIILFELILCEWKLNKITNDEVQKFLNDNLDPANELHMLLSCKRFGYWPNINFFTEHSIRSKFYSKCFFSNIEDIKIKCSPSKEISNYLMENLKPSDNNLFKVSIWNLENIISSKKSSLEISKNISKNKTVLIKDVLKIFNGQNSQKTEIERNIKIIQNFLLEKKYVSDALTNFLISPIEFRSSSCNICRQDIHLPAIYFLCKHVFHKECLSLCSRKEVCIVCTSSVKTVENPFEAGNEGLNQPKSTESAINTKHMSHLISNGFLQHNYIRNHIEPSCRGHVFYTEPFANNVNRINRVQLSTNPFEDENSSRSVKSNPFAEYDDNLNPFEFN